MISWQLLILIIWVYTILLIIVRKEIVKFYARKAKFKFEPHAVYIKLKSHRKSDNRPYYYRKVEIEQGDSERRNAYIQASVCPYCKFNIKQDIINKLMSELSSVHSKLSQDEIDRMKGMFDVLDCHIINNTYEDVVIKESHGYIASCVDIECNHCKSKFQIYFNIRKLKYNQHHKPKNPFDIYLNYIRSFFNRK